ncbi:MAG: hypothetical protein M2R45_00692 [Verrucomicrobia subdivision 3 bacterium]|nr:hypothetical protein [Limisphaerales bacterium]MCS1414424.1 hypothetical protein [Limisphaerales bacterium]
MKWRYGKSITTEWNALISIYKQCIAQTKDRLAYNRLGAVNTLYHELYFTANYFRYMFD